MGKKAKMCYNKITNKSLFFCSSSLLNFKQYLGSIELYYGKANRIGRNYCLIFNEINNFAI
jgi:hypothetical protein